MAGLMRTRLASAQASWRSVDLAALVLRVVLGAIFTIHGAGKLFNFMQQGGLDGTASFFTSLGIEPSKFWAPFVGVVEFAGGLMVLVGVLTVVASVALAVDMLVAIAKYNWANGFFVETPKGGWEFDLVLLTMALALTLIGAGALSLDSALGLTRRSGT
jgi:putative oxidoreductase